MTATPHQTAQTSLTRFAWLSIAAAVITIGLKTAAYWLTGSVGLLSDALESLVNLVAAIMALAMLTLAARPADEEHAYGQSKAEERPRALAALLTGKLRQLISIRKIVRPEIGSIYHITMRGQAKRLVLLANEFVVNFFTTFEKGVKTGWRVLNQQCRPLTIV